MNIVNLLYTSGYIFGNEDARIASGIAVLFGLLGFISIAQRILFGLAAYNDAYSKSNPDGAMWGVLIGIFGLIPGIIYLCVRNSGRRITFCPNCGFNYYSYFMNCPRCGAPNQNMPQAMNPYLEQKAHRAKVMLTIAIILFAVEIVMGIVCVVGVTTSVFSTVGNSVVY